MTRAEKAATAQRLRLRGLLEREIAQRMGVSQPTVSKWLNPPPDAKVIYERSSVALASILDNSGPLVPKGELSEKRPRLPRIPRFVGSDYTLSLDGMHTAGHNASGGRGEGRARDAFDTIADPTIRDPFETLVEDELAERVRLIVGDVDVEELDEVQLHDLRRKLDEAGLSPQSR